MVGPMNNGLAKSMCLVLFVTMTFLFLICVVAVVKWVTVSVLDALKLSWNASQSAADTSDLYSYSSLIFFVLALVFLAAWLYYREKSKL
jgi:hypothetical protein